MEKRNSAAIILLVFLLGSCTRKITQTLTLSEAEEITIHSGSSFIGPCEPSICINPINIDEMYAGSVLDNFYYSSDGGKNWIGKKLTSKYGVFGDPVVRVKADGSALYSHLSNPKNQPYSSNEFLDRIVVQSSADKGVTWTDGSFPKVDHSKDQDKQWLFCSPTDKSIILMSWTEFDKYGSDDPSHKSRILFSKSVDGGMTWMDAIQISELEGDCLDGDKTTEGAHPAIGVDGTYYVTWSYDDKIFLDYSFDQGKTWQTGDIVIANQPGGWAFDIEGIGRANGMPVMAVDHSKGKNRGTMYISWSDQRNGESDTDVWLIKSSDRGKTWSDPIRVNNDEKGKQQFFSWMDIDQSSGDLYWVFYDRRAYIDTSTDVFIARSSDAGRTIVNYKVSKSPFIPSTGVFFGDYNDISVVKGRVRPIWTRMDNGKLSVQTAIIQF